MKKSLLLFISLLVIFLWFSLAQSTWDDSIVDRLFSQFTKWTVQKRITCKNLNATMNALWKSVKLKLTNDPNEVRFNYIKTNFVEKARTYMNEKLNCASQTNTLNTTSTTTNKKIKTNTKMKSLEFSWYELCLWNPPENSTSNSVLYTWINWTHNINPWICTFVCNTNYTRNWNSCILNNTGTQYTSWACTPKPTNTSRNTVSRIIQTRDGSWRVPSLTSVYNTTPSTTQCRFKCNTNYTRNWNSCILNNTGTQYTSWACTPKPTNTSRNTVSRIIQTRNGSW